MTRNEIIAALSSEIVRLTSARDLLSSIGPEQPRRDRPQGKKTGSAVSFNPAEFAPKRRTMTAEGRARVAEAQRKRWAKRKRETARAAKASVAAAAARKAVSKKKVFPAAKKAVKKASSKKAPAKAAPKPIAKKPATAPKKASVVKATPKASPTE